MHYGCLIDPARALKPRDKPQVERPMPYVRDSFLAGPGVRVAAADAGRGRPVVAGSRRAAALPAAGRAPPRRRCSRPRRRTRCGRCRPSRSCWPRGRRRRSARTSTPRSTKCSIRCRGSTSARPPTCASPRTMVQFFIGGQLVKTHPRKIRGKQTDFGDYPPEKIAFHMRTPAWCRKQAAGIGPACEQVIGELLAEQRAVPAPLRAGRHRAGRQARPGPARGRLRESAHRRRPVLPHHQGHPGRRARTRPAPRRGRGRRRRVPARPRLLRERHPLPGAHQRRVSTPGRRRHDRPAPAPGGDRRRDRCCPPRWNCGRTGTGSPSRQVPDHLAAPPAQPGHAAGRLPAARLPGHPPRPDPGLGQRRRADRRHHASIFTAITEAAP